jgi:hypothetical protein
MGIFRLLPSKDNPQKKFVQSIGAARDSHYSGPLTAGEEKKLGATLRDTHMETVARPFTVMVRTHYRIVMSEMATSLEDITDLTTCVKVLGELSNSKWRSEISRHHALHPV